MKEYNSTTAVCTISCVLYIQLYLCTDNHTLHLYCLSLFPARIKLFLIYLLKDRHSSRSSWVPGQGNTINLLFSSFFSERPKNDF
jgi:hypothetical protein